MSTTLEPQTSPPEADDPWYIGWRYERREGPDGQVKMERVPLRQEDLLYPQEEDFIVENPAHETICAYLRDAMFQYLTNQPGTAVLHDCRVDWGVEGVQPLGPDFSVFGNVHGPWDRMRGTFYVAELDAKPLLAVEVTSPTTRNIDLDDKVDLYFRAGVPYYAVVDPRPLPNGEWEIRLMGYRLDARNPESYFRARLDGRGWLWLDTVRIWLAAEGKAAVCYDELGSRLLNHVEAVQAVQQAQTRAEAAEARLNEVEAELRRARRRKKP